jgi:aspartate carbamoyltransferase catalytic subunit
MENSKIPDAEHYFETYGLTKNRLPLLKDDAIIMHPGPINWNVEISDEVMNDQRSVILQQVSNGIAIRMAILLSLHNH